MAEIKDPYKVGQEKTANILSSFGNRLGGGVANIGQAEDFSKGLSTLKTGIGLGTTLLAMGALTGMQLKQAYSRIQNDVRRKAMIEDLILNDMIIKEAPREQVLEWYATIYNIAPKVSAEKPAVRELLQHFVKFGRIDLQTLKTLAETESKLNSSSGMGSVKDLIF
jgi:hypothetical protein